MSKLLFFDIDGTLLDDRQRLPDSLKPALEAARRNGHLLIINTGRTLCNLEERLEDYPLDGWIMGCGTRVVLRGETLRSMEYPPERSLALRHAVNELGLLTVYECDTALYFDPLTPDCEPIRFFRDFADRKGISREISAEDPEFRIVKLFCFADGETIREFGRRAAVLGMPYEAIPRQRDAWELVPAGYSKGLGMDYLRGRLGIAREDCYAFGDSTNDLPMFEHAGHSIAMGNAEERVKAVCSYVTDRPERDGIAKALQHFGLI